MRMYAIGAARLLILDLIQELEQIIFCLFYQTKKALSIIFRRKM